MIMFASWHNEQPVTLDLEYGDGLFQSPEHVQNENNITYNSNMFWQSFCNVCVCDLWNFWIYNHVHV